MKAIDIKEKIPPEAKEVPVSKDGCSKPFCRGKMMKLRTLGDNILKFRWLCYEEGCPNGK